MKLLPAHLAVALLVACPVPCILAADEKVEAVSTKPPKIPNVPVLDQDGTALRFYENLVKGKVVAINFVFTTCPTICPLMQVNFAQLQRHLKKKGASEVELISVTVDPVTDTPARLKAWHKQFGAQDGWSFVTGKKSEIDRLLKALEVFTADKNDHPSFILIGDEAKGKWKRIDSLAAASALAKELTQFTAAREERPGASKQRESSINE